MRFVVKAFLVVTVLSLTFNALVRPPRSLGAPDGRDVVVDGARVHYRVWGTHGSPIVLVHGFAESTVSWSLTAPELAKHHVVYAVDLPGAGYSQYTGRYSIEDQARAVTGLIKALHVERPVLVGHSLGAAVVGRAALDAPEAVGGVVFVDGDAMAFESRTRDPGAWASVVARLPYVTTLYRLGTQTNALARPIFDDQCGSTCRGLRGRDGDRFVEAWMRPLRSRDAEDAMRVMATHAMTHLSPEQMRAIRVPRGIVWGAEDATSGGSLAVAQANFAGAPTVTIPRAGHLSMIADPAGFATAVESVIGRLRAP